MYLLERPVTDLKGVGENRAKLLSKLKIKTINDLLFYFPRYIEDRSKTQPIFSLTDGVSTTVRAVVAGRPQKMVIRKNLTIYTMPVRDNSGTMYMIWYNNKYIENAFVVGKEYNFFGKTEIKYGKKQMENPTYEASDKVLHTGRIVPVYPLTENLHQKSIRMIMKECVDGTVGNINDYLPAYIREKYGICELNFALSAIHFPATAEEYEMARKRFIFEEFLFLQFGMLHIKKSKKDLQVKPINTEPISDFTKNLSFTLTNAQKKVIGEISADFSSGKPMNRLIQGDVGSGKTIVAFASMFAVREEGRQSVLMAPTEVLAKQHFLSAHDYFEKDEIVFLSGSMSAKEKKLSFEKIKSGQAKIIVGTHALLEDNVEFNDLALVVTDEQHRFGVRQRGVLAKKGESPHILIMSATPIPRTLSLIVYGELDVSVLDELPPGRQKVDTFSVDETMRFRINKFIEKNIIEGRQIYVVCPLIEESEKSDLTAAKNLAEKFQNEILPNYKTELLYGKMKAKEKNDIMERFSLGEIDILVSTTVIEVGVNVPNATVMIIENAERFGLSQLHQIRGRVGRGAEKSYCIMFSDGGSELTKKRLDIMTKTNDGFEIARRDLELRGPGDFLGTRQHGMPDLKIANIFDDMELLKKAGQAAGDILDRDLNLTQNIHFFLKQKINQLYSGVWNGNIIG